MLRRTNRGQRRGGRAENTAGKALGLIQDGGAASVARGLGDARGARSPSGPTGTDAGAGLVLDDLVEELAAPKQLHNHAPATSHAGAGGLIKPFGFHYRCHPPSVVRPIVEEGEHLPR